MGAEGGDGQADPGRAKARGPKVQKTQKKSKQAKIQRAWREDPEDEESHPVYRDNECDGVVLGSWIDYMTLVVDVHPLAAGGYLVMSGTDDEWCGEASVLRSVLRDYAPGETRGDDWTDAAWKIPGRLIVSDRAWNRMSKQDEEYVMNTYDEVMVWSRAK